MTVGPEELSRFFAAYEGNADVKEAIQAEQTATVTNLVSLGNSATAGWTGNSIDNTTNLFLDAIFSFKNPAVNTAPASNKAIYFFAYAGTNSTDLTTTGAASGTPGTEGALTFPDITANPIPMPLVGICPYPTQNQLLNYQFSIAKAYGMLPPFYGIAVINFSGMTLSASLTVKFRGVYNTVI